MVDRELLMTFVSETYDLLDDVEPQLIELSQMGDVAGVDLEMINAIFRLFHSMKGSAGYLGLSTISGVTHVAETLLDLFRKGKANLQVSHTLVLCQTIDFLRILCEQIEATDSDAGHEETAESIKIRLSGMIDEIANPGKASSSSQPQTVETTRAKLAANPRVHAEHAEEKPAPQDNATDITADMRKAFSQEATDLLENAEQSLLALEHAPNEKTITENLTEAFRALHSFKGNCGFMGFADPEKLAHLMECVLEQMRNGHVAANVSNVGVLLEMFDVLREAALKAADEKIKICIPNCNVFASLLSDLLPQTPEAVEHKPVLSQQKTAQPEQAAQSVQPMQEPTNKTGLVEEIEPVRSQTSTGTKSILRNRQDIRVDLEKLDSLINLVSELVIAEAMVTRHPHVLESEIEGLDKAVHQLRRVSRDLQDVAMSVRMIPLSGTFRKMIRLVHDLSSKSNKQIELHLLGEDTEVDKTVIEQIADPLVHIVRNAADHGLESPQEREAAGKKEQASITIEGRHEGGEVWILITDNGRGLNREKILAKAKSSGLVGSDADEWPDSRVFRLIFEPGFSTADKITDISGRGVGMDVVKKNIEKLKGKIDIRSIPGKGSTFILRIPLTLAIIEGMMVRVGDARYTIPLLSIRESFRPQQNWLTRSPDGQEVVRIRDEFYPLLRLSDRFKQASYRNSFEDCILILAESDHQLIALLVDEILGQQETVIKGLSHLLDDAKGVSGCTILGDGEVSLILDMVGLVDTLHETSEPEAVSQI